MIITVSSQVTDRTTSVLVTTADGTRSVNHNQGVHGKRRERMRNSTEREGNGELQYKKGRVPT